MHYDDVPEAAGLARPGVAGRHSDFSLIGIREGVVVGIFYKDQDGNRSRTSVEYTVRDLHTGQNYTSVRRSNILSGKDDGDDIPLRVARTTLSGRALTSFTRADDLDGDHVLFCFIEGARTRVVILGTIQHGAATYGATADDGERRLSTHKGTSVETKKDGSYTITRKVDDSHSTTAVIDADGNVKMTHKSGATLEIDDSGNVIATPSSSGKFKAGGTGGEPAVLGNQADARFQALEQRMTLIQAHTHPVAGALAAVSPSLSTLPVTNPQVIKAQKSENV